MARQSAAVENILERWNSAAWLHRPSMHPYRATNDSRRHPSFVGDICDQIPADANVRPWVVNVKEVYSAVPAVEKERQK